VGERTLWTISADLPNENARRGEWRAQVEVTGIATIALASFRNPYTRVAAPT
jgi:hypothetical protein